MTYIKIRLLSDMCAGSGESEGNAIDTDICMESSGIPYIPARRIKGCLRQSAEELAKMGHQLAKKQGLIEQLFGNQYGNESAFTVGNAYLAQRDVLNSYLKETYDDLPEIARKQISPAGVSALFTSVRRQTKLENGVKVDNTLRSKRVLNHYNPISIDKKEETELYAKVYYSGIQDTENYSDDDARSLLNDCCKATRHIGTSRNRGLGNVHISLNWDEKTTSEKVIFDQQKYGERVCISYKIVLEAPLTLAEGDETETRISARNVIGCMAAEYLKMRKESDQTFRRLFLTGEVRWSNLTPIISGEISAPTPLILMKLKNGGGKMINRLAEIDDQWKKQKPKTMEGSYTSIVETSNGPEYRVGSVNIHSGYHNSVTRKQLYMQDYIEPGLIYGGTIELPSNLVQIACDLLQSATLQFGRSKKAEYATCRLLDKPMIKTVKQEMIAVEKGTPIIVIARSDMVYDNGCYITDNENVRPWLATQLGVSNEKPEGYEDYCQYRTIGGYHTMWQLQKPHIPTIKAGSVFCFTANGSSIPKTIAVGEYQQEGFGLCEVYSLNELQKLKIIRVADVSVEKIQASEGEIQRFRTLILVDTALDVIRKVAGDYEMEKGVPIGRLRQMLHGAPTLIKLRSSINEMKTSDVSSEKKIGKKEACLTLVNCIYGDGKEQISIIREKEPALFDAVEHDPMAMECLKKHWKLPLDIILRGAHYAKGDK